MAVAVAILVFSGALALAFWSIHATLSEKRAVIVALLNSRPDPRFVTGPALRVMPRANPVRVRYAPLSAGVAMAGLREAA